jgi:hypothetical protein
MPAIRRLIRLTTVAGLGSCAAPPYCTNRADMLPGCMDLNRMAFALIMAALGIFVLGLAYCVGLKDGYAPCEAVNCEQRR